MVADFISLVLQGAGGGLAATADDKDGSDMGRNIMIAGVVFQVICLAIFMILFADFMRRVRRAPDMEKDVRFIQLRSTRKFQWFIYAIAFATLLIFVRSVYRVAELQQGFSGPIAQDEVLFMILEGPMIFLAISAVTILHPGYAFGGQWADAGWSVRGRKAVSGVDGQELMSRNKSDESV